MVLLAGLGLRLWGVRQGLPYPYNTDEAQHFVPHAVEMFRKSTLNPHYFANPPAFTYLLHFLFRLWYGSPEGAVRALELHPEGVYTLARVAVALLGTGSLWLLYATGARLFGRAVGLLAAAIEAVAFLPVFYAHLALNDVPTLFPLTLSLLGSAGVLRKGRRRDYLLAGVGLGLACASKYTAGIVLLPLLAAATARYLNVEADARAYIVGRRAAIGLLLAGLAALLAFLVANPYAVLDYGDFHAELVHQSTLSAEAQGKLGAPQEGGLLYYLWTLTWGLGWVPALAALGGMLAVWRRERWLGLMLVPAPLLFLLLMGLEGRYFGRWLLPIFPILCLLAAFFALRWWRGPFAAGAGARSRRAASRQRAQAAGTQADARVPCRAPADGAPRRRRRAARPACWPGPRLQRPLRPGALARRHAHPDARVVGRARAEGRADRGRARLPRRMGARSDPGDVDRGQPLSLAEVRLAVLADLRRRRARTGVEPAPGSRDRGLRAHARARR